MRIKVNKLREDAKMPTYKHSTDVGADVFLVDNVELKPGINVVPVHIAIEIPNGVAGFLMPRSGTAKRGITAEIVPIDPFYTGSIHAILNNQTGSCITMEKGERPAQLVLMNIIRGDFTTNEHDKRGNNAFNSTGR